MTRTIKPGQKRLGVTVVLTLEMFEALGKLAESEDRSLSNAALRYIKAGLLKDGFSLGATKE